jgi:hypothetical protein
VVSAAAGPAMVAAGRAGLKRAGPHIFPMADIPVTDEFLRKLAGWQALQQARQLVASGAVSESQRDGGRFTGRVQIPGKGQVGVALVVRGPGEAAGQCPCPEAVAASFAPTPSPSPSTARSPTHAPIQPRIQTRRQIPPIT